MKIGINLKPFANTYGRYGKDKFLKIKQHGYDAVDYSVSNTNIEFYSLDLPELEKRMKEEKNAYQAAGLTISQVHGPWQWPPRDSTPSERAERLEKMKKSVIISSLLDCKHLVIHPIMPFGIDDLKIGKEEETWNLNIEFFKELVSFAKGYDITICLENMPMPNFSIAEPKHILKFVETIDDEHLKICLDTGHVAIFQQLSIGEEIRRLNNYIKVVHIHDNGGESDEHLYPGKGIIDWQDFFNGLRDINFNGVLSLETNPSGELDDEMFEKESKSLCLSFKDIVKKALNKA